MHLEGGCQCGQLRYETTGEIISFVRCHCLECQAQSASGFGMSLYVPREGVSLRGEANSWNRPTASGELTCIFCAVCGSRVLHDGGSYLSIKGGSLDPGHSLAPVADIWVSRKQPWFVIPNGSQVFAGQPESKERLNQLWKAAASELTTRTATPDTHPGTA